MSNFFSDSFENITKTAVKNLISGNVIAYPTETVYGLGCDPTDQRSVKRINKIKQRKNKNGYILVAANLAMILPYIARDFELSEQMLAKYWPGATTLIFPASEKTPLWVKSENNTVAFRVSAHPLVHSITKTFNKPIISTSVNISGQESLVTYEQIYKNFSDKVDYIAPGIICMEAKPSRIINLITGTTLR